MAQQYLVALTDTEPTSRRKLSPNGHPSARKVARAQGLLHAAEGATAAEIAPALHLGVSTGHRPRQRLVDEGLLPAVTARPRPGKRLALTGKQPAFLIAVAGSTPPVGRRRWPLRLLADRLLDRQQVEAGSPATGHRLLKKRPPAGAA